MHAVDPLGYLEFLSLVDGSALVVTDSGGIQEETTVLGVPCLTLRPNTERPVTITDGTNRLVTAAGLADAVGAVLSDGRPETWPVPPLWDGAGGGADRRCRDPLPRLTAAAQGALSSHGAATGK